MFNKLRECLGILSRGNQMSHFAISHVRRWYLEKAIIPCLDKLFKGETND